MSQHNRTRANDLSRDVDGVERNVFVIGGTGAVGRHAVRALAHAGNDVTGIAGSNTKAEQFRRDGGRPVEVSIFDAHEFLRAQETALAHL